MKTFKQYIVESKKLYWNNTKFQVINDETMDEDQPLLYSCKKVDGLGGNLTLFPGKIYLAKRPSPDEDFLEITEPSRNKYLASYTDRMFDDFVQELANNIILM
jgi:hypothetical protein